MSGHPGGDPVRAHCDSFGPPLYAEDPLEGLPGERLRQNAPTGMIKVPLLSPQGLFDPLVTARVPDQFVKQRCRAGRNVEHRIDREDHLSIVSPVSPFVEDLLSWTEASLAGEPQGQGCRRVDG